MYPLPLDYGGGGCVQPPYTYQAGSTMSVSNVSNFIAMDYD